MSESSYSAVLVLGFGGPEGPSDVRPFLENVTRGRDVPQARLEEVVDQYDLFDGVSPLNEHNRTLVAALQSELDRRGRDMPVVLGNRNWAPFVEDTVAELAADGHERIVAFATSAFSSYSSCRQYLEDIDRARDAVGDRAPIVDKVRPFWNHPGYIEATVERVGDACDELTAASRPRARLLFTAHSIPLSMARTCDYEDQLGDAAELVVSRLGERAPANGWDLVFQSRSGPPEVPWLGPEIGDSLESIAAGGVTDVVVAPIGFLSDHMEVMFDLDIQAAVIAERHGLRMVRAATVGSHPLFVAGVADLIDELVVGDQPRALGPLGPRAGNCRPECCPPPRRPVRSQ